MLRLLLLSQGLCAGATLLACSPEPNHHSGSNSALHPSATPASEKILAPALTAMADQLILPWHNTFTERSAELQQTVQRFCDKPSDPSGLEATRASWREVMLAWQTLQLINFGPVMTDNQAWRIQFWPDSHNRVGQKVEALLAQAEPITATGLASANVLVQGLSALEYMLFDPARYGIEHYQPPRVCSYLRAASDNVLAVAQGLENAWVTNAGNFVGTFVTPGPNNLTFPSDNAVLAILVSAMVSNLEVLKNKKLGEAFGGAPGSGRINPYHLELWRSRISLEAMQQGLAANQQVFDTVIRPQLQAHGQQDLANKISTAFSNSAAKLASLPKPLFTNVGEPQHLADFQTTWDELTPLLSMLKRDVPQVLQLQLGFNANDGD